MANSSAEKPDTFLQIAKPDEKTTYRRGGKYVMVGDIGRTELATFRSLQRLKTLPDHIEVLPGAFSGSVCGRRLSGKPTSTIGFERLYNEAFCLDEEDAFMRFVQSDIPQPPPRAAELRSINARLAVA